ncbi:hypothetical protein lerEdw1_009548 [Lerista edwardsae]|nr:hypothetical protein lerEdw1_009548 [Lerista edwardsae]
MSQCNSDVIDESNITFLLTLTDSDLLKCFATFLCDIIKGMGCFWGAERMFWKLPGVFSTQVGFSGGFTPNPTYKEVRTDRPQAHGEGPLFFQSHLEEKLLAASLQTGKTGHAEVVRVVFDPWKISYEDLLRFFWEKHDPTQELEVASAAILRPIKPGVTKERPLEAPGMRQGGDVGTQYRSAVYTIGAEQLETALRTKAAYQQELTRKQLGPISTEIQEASEFYYAEDYHQQYLHKNPDGYCGLKGTGVACPIGK